jgi:hypothetical protein
LRTQSKQQKRDLRPLPQENYRWASIFALEKTIFCLGGFKMREFTPKFLLVCLFVLLFGAAPVALADWDPGDPNKMHWPQTPKPGGWDVDFYWTGALGDDWQCNETGPVSDIHFWASWRDNGVGTINGFRVTIFNDNPSGPAGHSEPNVPLWWRYFGPGSFTVRTMPPDLQGWFEPDQGWYWDYEHDQWCQINITNFDDPFIQKEGEIYWLVISDVNVTTGQLGWKETDKNFNDDAVWWNHTDQVWKDLTDPCTGLTMDLAFVITTGPLKHRNLKWSQPPIETDPCLPEPVYCGWDEESYTTDPAADWVIVADDFRCLGSMPVGSVHWWGSHVGWDAPDPPLEQPDAWRIGFWSNVPADPNPGADPNYSYPEQLLWDIEVAADRVHIERVGIDTYPELPTDTCYQYYVQLDQDEYFWQQDYLDETQDDVFWISIAAIYQTAADPVYPWGWKTRPWPWMDDAVKIWLTGDPVPGTIPGASSIQPIVDPIYGDSFDVAFELNTEPNYIKHQQPFTGIRHWHHYHDEVSMGFIELTPVTKWIQEPDLSPNGVDVDATVDLSPDAIWSPQILADDFNCVVTEPITTIRIWGSWYHDERPYFEPGAVDFTLSIYSDRPAETAGDWSEPNELLRSWNFAAGDFDVWTWAGGLEEGYYVPCEPYYEPNADTVCYQYDFYIDPCDAFVQRGEPCNPVVYWLVVEAQPLFDPQATQPVRFGWKTSTAHWNDDGVWSDDSGDTWNELRYPPGHPFAGESIDLAFEIATEQDVLYLDRLVADDWPCDQNTPITAAVWWGSYIDYRYQPCVGPQPLPAVKPDAFLLNIWTDVPADTSDPASYSHPNDIIWEYWAHDYDEVLVGYDKDPRDATGPPREPVFRYSVKLPRDAWFDQNEPNGVYWFSVVAVYDENEPSHEWGWTNHKHKFNDDAVEGYFDPPDWYWYDLYDQTGASQDMSFILFTDPDCLNHAAPEYADWVAFGKPDCWCYPRNCRGDVDGGRQFGIFWVYTADLTPFSNAFAQVVLPPGGICCDFARDIQFGLFRVYTTDLAIFAAYFAQLEPAVPVCDQAPITSGPYNFWTSP